LTFVCPRCIALQLLLLKAFVSLFLGCLDIKKFSFSYHFSV